MCIGQVNKIPWGGEDDMRKMAKVAAVVLVLVTLISIGQSTVMAAPAQAPGKTASSPDRFHGILQLLAAVWGGRTAVWGGGRGAIWGGRTAVWGGR